MRVVKGETRVAVMDVLLFVTALAAVAFQCFTGQPASLLRDAVTKLIAQKRAPTCPIWRFP
jgi:hypothetical protein